MREAQRSYRAPQARLNLRAKRAAREAGDENVPAKREDFLHYILLYRNTQHYATLNSSRFKYLRKFAELKEL